MKRAMLGSLAVALAQAASAAPLPSADKMIVLMRASGCDLAQLAPRLDAAGKAMAVDRRTLRVSIDRPADAARNLDLMGKPSPFAAALEVSAPASALPALARRVGRSIGTACPIGIYLVHERRLLTTPRTWPLGQPSPASKTFVTLNRKSGITFEQFDHEWAGPHAELALGWRKARGGNGHYVQNLVVGTIGPATPPLDGIGESEGPGTSPPSQQEREARVKTAAHAQTFQDLSNSTMFVARETILKDQNAADR
jgi:hypothetical protein